MLSAATEQRSKYRCDALKELLMKPAIKKEKNTMFQNKRIQIVFDPIWTFDVTKVLKIHRKSSCAAALVISCCMSRITALQTEETLWV